MYCQSWGMKSMECCVKSPVVFDLIWTQADDVIWYISCTRDACNDLLMVCWNTSAAEFRCLRELRTLWCISTQDQVLVGDIQNKDQSFWRQWHHWNLRPASQLWVWHVVFGGLLCLHLACQCRVWFQSDLGFFTEWLCMVPILLDVWLSLWFLPFPVFRFLFPLCLRYQMECDYAS